MSLKRRLLLAVAILVVVLATIGTGVILSQRQFLLSQVDQQLTTLATSPRVVLVLSASDRADVALADVYVGRLTRDGRLVTLQTPTEDPGLIPDLAATDRLTVPTGRTTTSGIARRVRVVTAPLPTGAQAVFAIPLTRLDADLARLTLNLTLGGLVAVLVVVLMLWWVYRLGLRPLAELTAAADAIARGEGRRRVEPAPEGTEAGRLGRAFNTMIDATQASEDRLRRFVADASHELRTPLTTLQGYSSLYSASSDPAEQADAVRRISREAARMRRIVDDLFLLNDLDVHGLAQRTRIDVVPLLRDAVADLQVVQPGRSVTLEVPQSAWVTGDADRITQAVTALTANALRYTPPTAAVTVRAVSGPRTIRVEVQDSGPGVAPEHLPHLFERFYRADRSRSRSQGGSGLGLAIVASIVRAHQGRYGVASRPGAGARFWFELPAA